MQTSRLISTIGYNSPTFLSGKLHDLVRQGIIEFAHWVWHEPEEDEKKRHAHILIKPNRRLDTSKLRNEFVEPVPCDKPLGVLPFENSKVVDWVLYAVHDRAYLLQKCQSRKHQYKREDIKTTEPELLDEHWKSAHEGENKRLQQVIALAEKGVEWRDILKMGIININQLFQYREVVFTFLSEKTDRNGKAGHDEG